MGEFYSCFYSLADSRIYPLGVRSKVKLPPEVEGSSQMDGNYHIALKRGAWKKEEDMTTNVNSVRISSFLGHI